jgi:hypothetical protein
MILGEISDLHAVLLKTLGNPGTARTEVTSRAGFAITGLTETTRSRLRMRAAPRFCLSSDFRRMQAADTQAYILGRK